MILSPRLCGKLYQCSTSLLLKLFQQFCNCYHFHNSQNILQTFDTKGATEICFNMFFNLEKILSSLALETGTVNNYMIINNILLQPLLLGAIMILDWLYTIKILLVWNSSERKSHFCIHFFFLRKPFFCLCFNFLNITLEIRLRFFNICS